VGFGRVQRRRRNRTNYNRALCRPAGGGPKLVRSESDFPLNAQCSGHICCANGQRLALGTAYVLTEIESPLWAKSRPLREVSFVPEAAVRDRPLSAKSGPLFV
jgi:hypothetical protein